MKGVFVDTSGCCSSFVIMGTLGLVNALTTDTHFEQAGFIRLLK